MAKLRVVTVLLLCIIAIALASNKTPNKKKLPIHASDIIIPSSDPDVSSSSPPEVPDADVGRIEETPPTFSRSKHAITRNRKPRYEAILIEGSPEGRNWEWNGSEDSESDGEGASSYDDSHGWGDEEEKHHGWKHELNHHHGWHHDNHHKHAHKHGHKHGHKHHHKHGHKHKHGHHHHHKHEHHHHHHHHHGHKHGHKHHGWHHGEGDDR